MTDQDLEKEFDRSLSPEEIDTRVAERAKFFFDSFQIYNRKLNGIGFTGAVMNTALLVNCVVSYFSDIERLKRFHRMPIANRYKRAGYTLKWFGRIRPIQLTETPVKRRASSPGSSYTQEEIDPVVERSMLINADFALIHALNWVGADPKQVSEEVWRELLYTVHYRDIDGGVMAQYLHQIALRWPNPAMSQAQDEGAATASG